MRTQMLAMFVCAGAALGQTGLPDQWSPWLEADTGQPATQFNVSYTGFVWQQEFTVSRPGVLTALQVGTFGNEGEDFTLAIRRGAAPSAGAELFAATITRTTQISLEMHTVDLTGAAIAAAAGEAFVLEARGNGVAPTSVIEILGSTDDPPLYPRPLYYNGSPFQDQNLRIGFKLYIDPDCDADLTGEGDVNTNDFFAFLALYQAQDVRADFAPDGSVNTNDFFAFLAAYQGGC